jgi:hypothetical protein
MSTPRARTEELVTAAPGERSERGAAGGPRGACPLIVTAEILALGVAYAVSGKLGLMLAPRFPFATLVRPPTGIALAALLLGVSSLSPEIASRHSRG